MIRNLKTLCLAVVAVLALTAVAASSASAAEFTSASGTYPVSLSASSTGDVFDAFGSSVQCTSNSFTGTVATGPAKAATVVPSYNNCKAFGTFPATVTCNSCGFNFTPDGMVHVEGSFTIDVYENATKHTEGKAMCQVHIASQTPTGTVTYTNNADGTIQISGAVSGVSATQTRNSIFCPAGTSTSSANYTIQSGGIKVTGTTGGKANPIHVK